MKMRKWTDQQKVVHLIKVIGGPAIALPILTIAMKIGLNNAKRILDLAAEIGPEETIRVLKYLSTKAVKIAA